MNGRAFEQLEAEDRAGRLEAALQGYGWDAETLPPGPWSGHQRRGWILSPHPVITIRNLTMPLARPIRPYRGAPVHLQGATGSIS
jgi:hypothetical protein